MERVRRDSNLRHDKGAGAVASSSCQRPSAANGVAVGGTIQGKSSPCRIGRLYIQPEASLHVAAEIASERE